MAENIASENSAEEELSFSEELVQSPVHTPAQTGVIDFGGLLEPPLRLYQDSSGGNGGQAWPAGMVLARYLLRGTKRDALKTSSMLGAGSGLVGLAIALGCRPSNNVIHITDQEPMLGLLNRNIKLNDLQNQVTALIYDWGGNRPLLLPNHPDVVLAADCAYFEPAFPLLQQTLRDLIGSNTTCYLSCKKRRRADRHFIKAVRKEFLVEAIMDDPDREVYTRENIFLCVYPFDVLLSARQGDTNVRLSYTVRMKIDR